MPNTPRMIRLECPHPAQQHEKESLATMIASWKRGHAQLLENAAFAFLPMPRPNQRAVQDMITPRIRYDNHEGFVPGIV